MEEGRWGDGMPNGRRRREGALKFSGVRWIRRAAADLEIGDTAGLETCATFFIRPSRGFLRLLRYRRVGRGWIWCGFR